MTLRLSDTFSVPEWVTLEPDVYLPCDVCGRTTQVRCHGAPRHGGCAAPDGTRPAPAPDHPIADDPAQRTPSARRSHTTPTSRATAVRDAIDKRVAAIDAGRSPRLLAALEHEVPPQRDGRDPYWVPPLPGITWSVYTYSHSWSRPYHGPVTVLDRSGAWPSAAASVDLAHGALQRTGTDAFHGAPGYYKIQVHPWHDTRLPHPLGLVQDPEVWVPHDTVKLLTDLAAADRWPDVTILDSYTCPDKIRLTDWIDVVQGCRAHAITRYGRDSAQYDAVKTSFGQALEMMLGKLQGPVNRIWSCRCRRPDYLHSVQALASATLWRWADDLLSIAPAVALRASDELVIPSDCFQAALITPRSRGRAPLQIDESGLKLGTFKVKEAA